MIGWILGVLTGKAGGAIVGLALALLAGGAAWIGYDRAWVIPRLESKLDAANGRAATAEGKLKDQTIVWTRKVAEVEKLRADEQARHREVEGGLRDEADGLRKAIRDEEKRSTVALAAARAESGSLRAARDSAVAQLRASAASPAACAAGGSDAAGDAAAGVLSDVSAEADGMQTAVAREADRRLSGWRACAVLYDRARAELDRLQRPVAASAP